MKRASEEQRFEAKVRRESDSGCWVWTGYVDPTGYARFRSEGDIRAHRWSFKNYVGEIPTGSVIDHVCRNRACVNPQHLRAVSSKENTHAPGSIAPAKLLREAPTCKHGHAWDEANTAFNKRGYRRCVACHREKGRVAREAVRNVSPVCPEGHERKSRKDGRLYCPTCASDARAHMRVPPKTTFGCGHERSETGGVMKNGMPYCTVCRVTARLRHASPSTGG